jgi:MFS family permease
MWIGTGAMIQGINIIVPTISATYGIDPARLLFWAMPASWGSVLAAFVVSKVCDAWGAKRTAIVCLVGAAICFGLLGNCGTLANFTVLLFGVVFFCSGYAFPGGLTLVANWFPHKKELALGWITMGNTLSSTIFIPVFAGLVNVLGPRNGFLAISAIMSVLALLVGLFIRNLPEEVGCTPDNVPMSVAEIAESRRLQTEIQRHSPVTVWQLLKMRDVWLLAFGTGFMYIYVVGYLIQVIPRIMSFGFDQSTAIFAWTVASLLGLPTSYGWGWLGQKFGIRRAYVVFNIWCLIAIVLNIFSGKNIMFLWISLAMLGISLGGSSNYATAIVAEKFPRAFFIKAYGVIAPVQGILRCCAFSILGFGLAYLGGYEGAYALLVAAGVISCVMFLIVDLSPVDAARAAGAVPAGNASKE